MNKYQKRLLKEIEFELIASVEERGSAKIVDETLELTQNENYNLNEYNLKLLNCVPSKVEIDGKVINLEELKIDFTSPAKSLTLYFANDIVEPINLKLKYIRANKEAFDLKINEEKTKDYIEKASIKCSTGPSLVNIYFQPCDEKCFYTIINLYKAKGRFDDGLHGGCCVIPPNWKPTLVGGEIEQMIGNYKVEEGSLFKSITELADGVYGYTLSQYDKDDNKLFETNPKYFVIR